MPLTETKVRNAKAQDKPYRLTDGGGMYLEVATTGSKYWRWKYRFDGKEKRLALGVYPEVTLAAARLKRDAQRKLLKERGSDPLQARREEKIAAKISAGNTFEAVARQWWEHWKSVRSPRHADYVIRRLEADIFPTLTGKPVTEITAPQLLAVIRKIEKRGALDLAKRALQTCGQIFRYAVAHGICERNPVADVKPQDALKPRKKENFARLSAQEFPELLRKIETYDGAMITRLALRIMALTFVRTSELIGARWKEFDLTAAEWRIPAERMKMKTPAYRAIVAANHRNPTRTIRHHRPQRIAVSRRARSSKAHEQQHDFVRLVSHGLSLQNDRAWFPWHCFNDPARKRLSP